MPNSSDQAGSDEDAHTARIVAETGEAIARGDDVALPGEVWDAIEAGENAVRVLREHRGLTRVALARAVGVSQDDIAGIESGRRLSSPERLSTIARALQVPLAILMECGPAMRTYLAVVHKEAGSAYGASFPDFPSVFSAADEACDIIANAIEALRLWAKDAALPKVSSLDEVLSRQDVRAALAEGAFLVRVPLTGEEPPGDCVSST